jgi:hypothetical protein
LSKKNKKKKQKQKHKKKKRKEKVITSFLHAERHCQLGFPSLLLPPFQPAKNKLLFTKQQCQVDFILA